MRQSTGEMAEDGRRMRAATIAAMGQRLAAAGPRMRQKTTRRLRPADMVADDPAPVILPEVAERSHVLVADRSHAFMRDNAPILPPSPRCRAVVAIGRTAALAIMASTGFALVLLAQSPRWSAVRPIAATKTAAMGAPKAPQSQPAAVPSEAPSENAGSSSVPPAPVAAPDVHPPLKADPAPPAAAPPSRPLHVQLALAHQPRPVFRRAMPSVARRDWIRPTEQHPTEQHRAVLAHYDLPSWLTAPRPLVMSPPPHDLTAPESTASPLPPLPHPRFVYASAGTLPPLRPAPYGAYQPQ